MTSAARKMQPAAEVSRILEVPEIVERWNEIKPLLASVGSKGQYWSATPGHAFAHFHDGTWTLWALGDPVRAVCAVGVSREHDGSHSLRLEQVAGRAAWNAELEPIAAWARQRGCVRIVMPRARRGWARVFRKRFAVTALYLRGVDIMSNDEPDYVTQKTDSAPWATQQPYLEAGFKQAQGLLNKGATQYYPNATYVPMSDQTQGSLMAGETAAQNQWNATNLGNMASLTPNAINQTLATARGDYLTQQNPYFSQMLQNTFDKAQPTIQGAFAGAGRGISGAQDAALSNAWATAAGNLGYQDYAKERQNQIAAIAASPEMAQAGLAPAQAMAQVGQAREGYAGSELQDALKRWDATQNADWTNLSKYMTTVGGGGYGSQQTQMVPQTSNPWAEGIGYAGAGASILRTLREMWR